MATCAAPNFTSLFEELVSFNEECSENSICSYSDRSNKKVKKKTKQLRSSKKVRKDIVTCLLSKNVYKTPINVSRRDSPLAEKCFSDNEILNKTVDKILKENGLSLGNCDQEDHLSLSDDDFDVKSSKPDTVHRELNVKAAIDKIFEGCDDYAAFSFSRTLGVSTPISKPQFSGIDSNIKPTPYCSETSFRDKTIMDDSFNTSNLFLRLPFSNLSYFSNLNASKSNGESLGTCEYPLGDKSEQFNLSKYVTDKVECKTPFSEKSKQSVTPVLMSGFRRISSPSLKTSTPITIRYSNNSSTPLSHISRHSSLLLKTPEVELPPEIKKTLLVGVTCFVDVKTNNENCSESVKLELLSMGAKVEKTFNKKVDHVVFKEGRVSVYLKAKRLGIPMVSVLWLEACKRERKMIDPSLYPPVNMDKFEELSPNGIKLPSLKTIQKKLRKLLLKEASLLREGTTISRSNPVKRNAITEVKIPDRLSGSGSQGRHVNKKLDFASAKKEEKFLDDEIIVISSEVSRCDPSSDESFTFEEHPLMRRKSAPGRILSVRYKRKRKGETEDKTKYMTLDKMFEKQILSQQNKTNDQNKENIKPKDKPHKLRKLLDPVKGISDSPIVIDDDGDMAFSIKPSDYPFTKDQPSSLEKKPRTKSSCKMRVNKKFVHSKQTTAKKCLKPFMEQDNHSLMSCSRRSSMALFVQPKENELKMSKEPPTIVFTSMTGEEVQKAGYITGKLGLFDIEDKVSPRTTHVVSAGPRRTVNLLKAIARGCWILTVDWLHKSEASGCWLNEEDFEMKNFSPAVVESRLERQAFGPQYCLELFSSCGPIYVSRKTSPPHGDLTELIRLCKGKVVTHAKAADIIIGGTSKQTDPVPRLREKWVLDSITQNELLHLDKYKALA